MPSIDVKKRRVQSKIVYYGPGRSGKTAILQYIHEHIDQDHRGKLNRLPTRADPSQHIDVLPVRFGQILGFDSVFHLCGGPGVASAVKTRRLLLRDADGIVFVVDCDPRRSLANEDALSELRENLETYGLNLCSVPHVFMYHKCDLDRAVAPARLREQLNLHGVPDFESSVEEGTGILEALRAIVHGVKDDLRRRL